MTAMSCDDKDRFFLMPDEVITSNKSTQIDPELEHPRSCVDANLSECESDVNQVQFLKVFVCQVTSGDEVEAVWLKLNLT